jgi:hypothetical protein
MAQEQDQFYTPSNSDEIKREEKDGRHVTIAATTSTTPLNVTTVMDEIDRIAKEIEELQIRNIGTDDPEYKENAKKLLQIRKYLAKKTKPATPSTTKTLWNKIKELRHRRGHVRPSNMEPTPSELMEIATEQGGSSNYLNYSVDDAFMYGAECMLSLLNMIRAPNSQNQ